MYGTKHPCYAGKQKHDDAVLMGSPHGDTVTQICASAPSLPSKPTETTEHHWNNLRFPTLSASLQHLRGMLCKNHLCEGSST